MHNARHVRRHAGRVATVLLLAWAAAAQPASAAANGSISSFGTITASQYGPVSLTFPARQRERTREVGGDGPTLSADGTTLAFGTSDSSDPRARQIVLADPNGSHVRTLLSYRSRDGRQAPSWSPSGDELVFTRTGGLRIVGVRHADVRRITRPTEAVDAEPSWSPDGSRIAFQRCASAAPFTCRLMTVRPDGTGLTTVLTAVDGERDAEPDWSPDSRRLVFATGRWSSPANDLAVVGVDGHGLRRLSPSPQPYGYAPAAFAHPAWSPDGRTIACAGFTGDAPWDDITGIILYAADGSAHTRLRAFHGTDDGVSSVEWGPPPAPRG